MKVVPKVNTDGLYMSDIQVDESFFGVSPLYADQVEEENIPPKPVGYSVGIPIKMEGLYKPKFDLLKWDKYQEDVNAAQEAYASALDEWEKNGSSKDEMPLYNHPEQPENLWSEGMSQAEIDELNKKSEDNSLEDRMSDLEKAFADFVMSGL
jgi:hypothetical protein